jgi:hypothetical protein
LQLHGADDLGADEDEDYGVVGPEHDGEEGAEETSGKAGGRMVGKYGLRPKHRATYLVPGAMPQATMLIGRWPEFSWPSANAHRSLGQRPRREGPFVFVWPKAIFIQALTRCLRRTDAPITHEALRAFGV